MINTFGKKIKKYYMYPELALSISVLDAYKEYLSKGCTPARGRDRLRTMKSDHDAISSQLCFLKMFTNTYREQDIYLNFYYIDNSGFRYNDKSIVRCPDSFYDMIEERYNEYKAFFEQYMGL